MLVPKIDKKLADAKGQEQHMPGYGYRLDTEKNRIRGTVDYLQSVQQAVLMILATEQGMHPIYKEPYGLQTADLIGKPHSYAANELQRRIKEALLWDNRIHNVYSFSSYSDGDKLLMSFTVESIYGSFETAKEVGV